MAPDGHWVICHKILHPNTNATGQTISPNLPALINISKSSSDSTDIQMVCGCWGGGIVGNIPVGQQPDGDYVSAKATGATYDMDGNVVLTTTPLTASSTYTSGWVDTDGWGEFELVIATDQVSATDGISISFTDNTQAASPTTRRTITRTFDANAVSSGSTRITFPPEIDGMQISYTNGGTNQGSFFLACTSRSIPSAQLSIQLSDNISATDSAIVMRGPLDAENDSAQWSSIKRSDSGGLRVSIKEQEAELMSKATDTQSQTSLTASSTFAQIDSSKLSNRKYFVISNHDNNTNAFYGAGAGHHRLMGPYYRLRQHI
jgi:hypothetical protein